MQHVTKHAMSNRFKVSYSIDNNWNQGDVSLVWKVSYTETRNYTSSSHQ